MKFLYRISNNSYNKPKLKNATKEHCFLNFLHNVLTASDTLEVLADNINSELKDFLQTHLPNHGKLVEINVGSNGASFRLQMQMACESPDHEIVVLHEDDYLYRPHLSDTPLKKFNQLAIAEGLTKSHYVSLYDHPDKYIPRLQVNADQVAPLVTPSIDHPLVIQDGIQWGNPLISDDGVENTGIFLTERSHWKYTNSTTLTFAAYAKTLKEDYPVWEDNSRDAHPHDYWAFTALGKAGRKIATPIPGLSTNTELPWISPLFDWEAM